MVGKEYQYETSPRKLRPEYEPQKKRKVVKKTNKNQKINTKTKKNNKINIIVYILIGFSVLFTISYRNSQINESFAENQKLLPETVIPDGSSRGKESRGEEGRRSFPQAVT